MARGGVPLQQVALQRQHVDIMLALAGVARGWRRRPLVYVLGIWVGVTLLPLTRKGETPDEVLGSRGRAPTDKELREGARMPSIPSFPSIPLGR